MEEARETAEKNVEAVDKSTKRTHKKPKPLHRWSRSVERSVKALKQLEYEAIKHLRVNYYVELHALDTKYQQLFIPLDQRRCDIISGDLQLSDDDCHWSTDESDTEINKSPNKETSASETGLGDGSDQKGIPDFWLHLLEGRPFLPDPIQDHDRAVLKSLKNIRIVYLPDRYRLELVFGDNDYFVNSVLSKEYEIDFTPSTVGRERLHYYGLTITACTGCDIDWKPGKNVTKIGISDDDDAAGYKDSFFNMFSRTAKLDLNAEDEVRNSLVAEFLFVRLMRDDVLPHVASIYANYYAMTRARDSDSYVEDDEDDDYYPPGCTCDAASSYVDDDAED